MLNYFSKNTRQVIRNSSFQLSKTLVAKLGSLLFTILLAGELITVRLLGFEKPLLSAELFGLYSLALSTIIIFSTIADFGMGKTFITFISKSLGNNENKKAKAYFIQLFRWKISLLIFVLLILLILMKPIILYYNKPIFYSLLAGIFYLVLTSLVGVFETIFIASNLFRYNFYKEVLLQCSRFVLVPLGVILMLNLSLSNSVLTSGIIIILSFCYLISFIFLYTISRKKINFMNERTCNLTNIEKKDLLKFLLPLSAMALSGVFFGYIDTLMLGHFVEEQFIAYYCVAFALISSATVIVSFTGNAVLPIFSRINGNLLEENFRIVRMATFLIGCCSAVFTYFIARYVVLFIYGSSYESSIQLLQLFSLLLISIPLSTLYNDYFISQGRTKIIATFLILTTILNVVLNYFFITYGLQFGMYEAVLGAVFATLISRSVYLLGLGFAKRRKKNDK